jgi:hypothetical protein
MTFRNKDNANMTSLKGEFAITFAELTEIFGRPDHGPNSADLDKVTCEWCLQFEDGTVATIYDWKTWRTPMGEYEWHIGGHSEAAVDRVVDTIAMHRDQLVSMIRGYQGA